MHPKPIQAPDVIISHKHRFIFIKTRKTAGTSVQEALERICGPDDIVTRTGIRDSVYRPRNYTGPVDPRPYLFARPRRHGLRHILWRTLSRERIFDHMYLHELFALPETRAWRGYYRFCFDRNPWDKTVSRYFWKYRGQEQRPDFEYFLSHGRQASDFDMYSLDGQIAVDFIGRYEDLAGGLATVSKAIGCEIPQPGLRNAGTRKKRDYRAMYSPQSRDLIARLFSREIAALGYSFD